MTIHFNPYYDKGAYVDISGRGILLDSKIVGPNGLLAELEERLGLTGTVKGNIERLVLYVKAMRKALNAGSDLFFRESFKNDEIGTASTLLQWRDAAIAAGWDPNATQPSRKFQGLAAIEKVFEAPGYSDRWTSLYDYLNGDCEKVGADINVEVNCSKASIEPYITRVLDSLPKAGIKVDYNPTTQPCAQKGTDLFQVQQALLDSRRGASGKTTLSNDGSIRIIRFPDYSDAQQWAASVLSDSNDILMVNESNNAISDILYSLDKPTVASTISVDSTAAQVFRIGISLFGSPVDVNNLLAYLRLPVNPLSGAHVQETAKDGTPYYRSLNHELADSLLSTGGLTEWKDIISSAVYDNDGAELDPKQLSVITDRLYMWDKTKDGKVKKADVLAYLDNLCAWSANFAYLKSDPNWSLIKDLTAAFRILLENEPAEVPFSYLSKWAMELSVQSVMPARPAQSGSISAVSDIRSIFDSPQIVVWLDCVGSESPAYAYDFLSPSEQNCLSGGYPEKEAFSASSYRAIIESVSRIAGTLTLVVYDTANCEKCRENPFVTELKTRFDVRESSEAIPDTLLDTRNISGPVESKIVHTIDPLLISCRRKQESYSSLSKLFQSPFDYVLDYLLCYGSYGEETIVNVDAVRGTVAHKYIEDLINDCHKDIKAMISLHQKEFDKRILEAASNVGVILLADENKLAFGRFKALMEKSINNLLQFIDINNLVIIGPEYEISTELPVIGKFYAKIDLLLQNGDGKYVIVDFKWSEGSYYEKVLENNRNLQLALYEEAVKKGLDAQVLSSGYFILPRYQFYTNNGGGLSNVKIVVPAQVTNVFEQACNSYEYRMNQLKSGMIEEAESCQLADIEYAKDTELQNLYPLDVDYNNHSIKASDRYGKNIILKGGLE